RETVKESGAPGALQVLLAAPARRVRRIPGVGARSLAHAIVMANLGPARAAGGPASAREIFGRREGRAVRPRAGEDVVLVGRVARAIDQVGPLGGRRVLPDLVGAVKLLRF